MSLRSLAALSAVLLLALSGCGDDDGGGDASDDTGAGSGESVACEYPEGAPAEGEVDPPPDQAAYDGEVAVTLGTSVGDLEATLDADSAPCTVNSFTSLAEQGFFDGTTCHRLTTEGIFVLQCGDPTASGMGGPGYSFADELDGEETYGPGTLAMANSGPDTNGSQFFIVYGESPLPPSYTVFGTVSEQGVGIVEDVAEEGTDNGTGDGAPKTPVEIGSVEVG